MCTTDLNADEGASEVETKKKETHEKYVREQSDDSNDDFLLSLVFKPSMGLLKPLYCYFRLFSGSISPRC